MIHKPGKPQDTCSSYRPISLLNYESKVLAKVLATRLGAVIQSLIHPDQSGFMPHRNTRLNLRRLFGVIQTLPMRPNTSAALLSLDAHMAFDSIEWNYLCAVLTKLGFGDNFRAWVQLLYTDPLARVCVNGTISRVFQLRRGTRQGCPLSPTLFALALELLTAWIRMDSLIWGIDLGLDGKSVYPYTPTMSSSMSRDRPTLFIEPYIFYVRSGTTLAIVSTGASP